MNTLKPWDMDGRLFWRLRTTQDAEEVCRDRNYKYYAITLNGYRLMYRQNRWRQDGCRMYRLGDELAKAMGFADYADMRYWVTAPQYSKGWLSVKALERHFR